MANLKTVARDRVLQLVLRLTADMGAKIALANGVEERPHFIFLSVHLKFYATVNQIAHPASDIEPFRYVSNRPAKTDTLNIAFVKYLERDHAMRPN
jgi:hypothetical protein